MREAGKAVAQALGEVRKLAEPGTTADMDEAVADVSANTTRIPLFLATRAPPRAKPPFPAVVCASVNEHVVHGIPNRSRSRRGTSSRSTPAAR